MIDCCLVQIDHLKYTRARRLMHGLVELKRSPDYPEVLLILEHEPVITLGRRGQSQDIYASLKELEQAGLTVHHVERGGLVTYHGPGQLVAYPVFRLRRCCLGVVDFVRALEEVVILVLGDFGLTGRRREGYPGVWVGPEKIASLGVAVRRGVTFHGLALNYAPDLANFDLINPCGLTGVRITSMDRLLPDPVEPVLLRARMQDCFARVFNLNFLSETPDRIKDELTYACSTPQTAVA